MSRKNIKPGQKLKIKPESKIYNDIYEVEIIEISNRTMNITMPYSDGKIVLLGVGTDLQIIVDEYQFQSRIIDKNHSSVSFLTITLPDQLCQKNKKEPKEKNKAPKIIAVTSGKGGVGKTNFVINLGITLTKKHGLRTFIIDADLGTANVDVLLNLSPKYTIQDLIEGKKNSVLDIVMEGPEGVQIVPGGSGFQSLTELSDTQLSLIINKFKPLQEFADVILIDTSAGISKNVVNFALAADEVIVITTPEPHAITDAYAIIKVLNEKNNSLEVKLVINRADTKKEAQRIMNRMEEVVERFLEINVKGIGYIFEDPTVRRAIKNCKPYVKHYPLCPASKCVTQIASKLNLAPQDAVENKTQVNFLDKLKKIFSFS